MTGAWIHPVEARAAEARPTAVPLAAAVAGLPARGGEASPRDCNSGSPMSRSRRMALRSTILGARRGPVWCPRVWSVALDFGQDDPLERAYGLVSAVGFASAEAARDALIGEQERCICSAAKDIRPIAIDSLAPEAALEQALVLGLSTTYVFDPGRPVIWTRASLSRRLHLYEIGSFYA